MKVKKIIVKKWKEKTKESKTYLHFDNKKNSTCKKIVNYIKNPKKIEQHSFYPFLHSQIIFKKFNKDNPKEPKLKIREINYSAHIDRLIFSYYSQILNSYYNNYVLKIGVNGNIIAYRDNLKKNNIHFSKETFDDIRNYNSCFILIGDFTNFFDNLEHNYLKKQICKILNVEKLKEDWYTIFKNITRFSYCELEEIKLFNKKENKEINKFRMLSPEFFRKLRKNKEIEIKKNIEKGIPQGSAISAVLANVYMNEFDYKIKTYINEIGGKYYRYSDDFIVICPLEINKSVDDIKKQIKNIVNQIPNLELQEQKTKCFFYFDNKITNLSKTNMKEIVEHKKYCVIDKKIVPLLEKKDKEKDFLNFLGFSFDGEEVRIRDKTISKYYYRMYRKIKYINKNKRVSKYGNVISCKELYENYSIKRRSSTEEKNLKRKNGNFITYVERAEKIFGKDNKNISHLKKVHLKKIRKRILKVSPNILHREIIKKREKIKNEEHKN